MPDDLNGDSYPKWLKLTVAFCTPAFASSLAVASSGATLLVVVLTFFAAGFGGLGGLGLNTYAKLRSEGD